MTLKFIFLSLKHYGLKGMVDFVKRKISGCPLDSFLDAHTEKSITPQPGITIIGHLDLGGSLSKVLRDLAIMLSKAGIPHQVLNTPCDHPIPENEYKHLLTPMSDFITNRYTDVVTMVYPRQISDPRCRISTIHFWEFDSGLKEAHPEILNTQNIIAMSEFNRVLFKTTAPNAKIRKILYPFQFNHGPLSDIAKTRKKFSIPNDSFAVFFNFDFTSSYYRKNPQAILKSFSRAFSCSDNAVIVLKTMRAEKCAEQSLSLHRLAIELGIENKLITIDGFIPQEDVVNLTNACDVYMSLHRGEGFGLGIAEAMTLGKPVIVTDYSATTEFCNKDNAILIPFKTVNVPREQIDVDAYKHVTHWAEPDIEAAAAALRRLYDDPTLRQTLGKNGKQFIEEHFSAENFKKSINEFLKS